MKKYLDWAKREYSLRQQVIILGFAGVVFLLLIPYVLVVSAPALDQRLGLPRLDLGVWNLVFGLLLVGSGAFLAVWSVGTQVIIGSGTPVPMMPTQRLIISGPFLYCRNPMTLGTFLGYSGIGMLVGSISAIALVTIFVALLLVYIRLLEEKELEARFGPDYLDYKRRTPFLLPRRPRRR